MRKLFKIIQRFGRQIKEDNVNSYASSCAFFIFLSIIPMIMLLFAILPYTPADPKLLTDWVIEEFPAGTGAFIASIISDVSSRSIGLISITAITTIWAAGKGINALMAGFNAIDKNIDRRNGIVLRIISSLYTLIFLAGVVVLLVIVVGGKAIMNIIVGDFPNLSAVFGILVNFRSLISLVLMSFIFMLCFSLLPCKKHKFRETFPGAVLAALAWTGFSYLFSFYVNRFNAFNMYGSLTTIIVLMFWLYICMYILFIGANLNHYFRPVILAVTKKDGSLQEVKGQFESLEE